MSIIERPPPPVGDAAVPSERLRVITAGRVGNMEARLGTSGFDVVAIADTEEDLMIAVTADNADAIVVDANLCTSLEHIRDLAPDAVLIVVGDHTPAGALGRIEAGVSGTVMAGLLHALVAEGVAGAAVWGLVPSLSPPAPMPAPHTVASAFAAKLEPVRRFVSDAIPEHAGLVATAGTVVVTTSVALLLTLGAPHPFQHAPRPRVDAPVVQGVSSGPTVPADDTTSDDNHRPASPHDATSNVRPVPAWDTSPRDAGRHHASSSERGLPPEDETVAPAHGVATSLPANESAPGNDASPTSDASRPPGVAHGWDGHRPPKNDDPGGHAGWTKGHGQDEAPEPQTTEPRGQAAAAPDQATEPRGQAAAAPDQATEPRGQAAAPDQAAEPRGQAVEPDEATEPLGLTVEQDQAMELAGQVEEQAGEATQ